MLHHLWQSRKNPSNHCSKCLSAYLLACLHIYMHSAQAIIESSTRLGIVLKLVSMLLFTFIMIMLHVNET